MIKAIGLCNHEERETVLAYCFGFAEMEKPILDGPNSDCVGWGRRIRTPAY
jgi:hypothetical protein